MTLAVFKSPFIAIVVSFFISLLFEKIKSDFVYNFLTLNITNIQVALLAVNAATLGIILSKIREIIEITGSKKSFAETRRQMIISLNEQIVLIFVSMIILAMASAKTPIFDFSVSFWNVMLLGSFIYSILILYDTAKSVFVILDF